MISEEAHKKLARRFVQQRNMRERVGADVSKSLKFFQEMYGPPPVRRFYATEIPGWHGEAFPGMVHLSWVTFQNTSDRGRGRGLPRPRGGPPVVGHRGGLRELPRPVAQRGLLQLLRPLVSPDRAEDNDKYFDMLRQWRSSILLREGEPGPISLGYRVFASKDDDLDDYQTVVYKKGAWVMHMLRILMLDLKTMSDDRFTAMMKDFYAKYEGRRASTEDFQRVVERHTGAEMGWFFDQWVHCDRDPHVSRRAPDRAGGERAVPGAAQGPAGGRTGELPDVRAGDARSRQGPEGAGAGEGEGAGVGDRAAAHAGGAEEREVQ